MAVKITREAADARRHLWVEAPLDAEVDGRAQPVLHWSIGGVALAPGAEVGALGSTHAVRVGVTLHGIDMAFTTDAVVERDETAGDGAAARHILRFTDLTQAHRDLLGAAVDSVTRNSDAADAASGAATAVVPAASQLVSTASARAPSRVWYNSGVGLAYTALSLAVIGYLGNLGLQHVKWHQASNAVMTAPSISLVAQGEGHVELAQVRAGDAVKRGDLIATVSDNALERDIELATLALQDREARFLHAKKTSPIKATVDLAKTELDLARSRRETLVRHRERLMLRSPIDGTLTELNQLDRMGVRRGDVVAEVQAPADGTVTAFVTSAEAQRLQPDGAARIRLPGAFDSVPGRIVRIETVPPQPVRATRQSAAQPRNRPVDAMVRVTVAMTEAARAKRAVPASSGEPVVVMLEKAAGRYWSERLGLGAETAAGTVQSMWSETRDMLAAVFTAREPGAREPATARTAPRDVVAASSKRPRE